MTTEQIEAIHAKISALREKAHDLEEDADTLRHEAEALERNLKVAFYGPAPHCSPLDTYTQPVLLQEAVGFSYYLPDDIDE